MSAPRVSEPLAALRRILRDLPSGRVLDVRPIEHALAAAWETLAGDDGGMEGYKLDARTEDMHWHPPILTFTIERHGGKVLGSKYGELQRWSVNVEAGTAVLGGPDKKRRLRPLNPRLDTQALAVELADHIRNGRDDSRLTWRKDRRRVRVRAVAYGGHNVPKETAAGRAKRLRRDLAPLLVPHGWNLQAGGWWEAPLKEDGA